MLETGKLYINTRIKAATSHVISHFILRDSLSWNTNILPSIHHHLFHYGEQNIQFAEAARALVCIYIYIFITCTYFHTPCRIKSGNFIQRAFSPEWISSSYFSHTRHTTLALSPHGARLISYFILCANK